MVHILAPRPSRPQLRFFYNVDQPVGTRGANIPADVMLVQFMLKKIGERPHTSANAPLIKSFASLKVTGNCDAETIGAIKSAQAMAKAGPSQPDGRVSVANGYGYGSSLFTIADFNYNFRVRYPNEWPAIWTLPGCPGLLANALRDALLGTVPLAA